MVCWKPGWDVNRWTQDKSQEGSVSHVLKLNRYVAYIILRVENYNWREEATYDKLTNFHKEIMLKDCK
jgi:hypothetical protein